jgi:ferrous iron transport protein A
MAAQKFITDPTGSPMTQAPPLTQLDTLETGRSAVVVHVAPGDPEQVEDGADLARRLMELGFVPGERIRMLKRGMPGGEPLAIKVGNSTFALRRFEAALISIQPE